MEWKKITDAFTKINEKMAPVVKKAKEYGEKAVVFTGNQIQTTPLFLKTQDAYDIFSLEKRTILIAYDDRDIAIQKDIRIFSPAWMARAFMDTATFRFINIREYPDLVKHIGIEGPVDMRVGFEGTETFRFTDMVEIKKWWKATHYGPETPDTSSTTAADPLAAVSNY